MKPNQLVLLTPVFISALLTACSSAPVKSDSPNTHYAADKVVGRSDDLSSRPKWVSETMSVTETDGNTNFIGVSEVPGDSRPQAAFKISDAAARGNLANKVKTNVTKIVQSSESGLSMDDQQLNSLIQEVSQISLHNVDVKDRYWEKVVHTDSSGQEKLELKTFSLISLPQADVKKMVLESIDEAKSDKAVHAQFKGLVNDKWQDIPAE